MTGIGGRMHQNAQTGEVRDRKKLTPDQFRRYMSDVHSVVALEKFQVWGRQYTINC